MKKHSLLTGIVIAILLTVLALGGLWFHQTYTVISGTLCKRDAQTLDLSGKSLSNVRGFAKLEQLQQLDLTGTKLSLEDYLYLREALPGCKIRWELPFQGGYLPMDTTCVTVTELAPEDIALLENLPLLEAVDATACTDMDAILALCDRYPKCKVYYNITVGGEVLDQDAAKAVTSDLQEIKTALAALPMLTEVDATGCGDPGALLQLQQQYPGCTIRYLVDFAGSQWQEDTASIAVKSVTAQEIEAVLPWLPKLTQLTVTEPMDDISAMPQLCAENPDITITYSFSLLGKTVSNRDTQLDLSGTPLTSTQELEAALPNFAALEKVDMCHCGLSDQTMAQLNRDHPETLFVWTINMGKFELRTDITYFMPFQYRYEVTDRDADKLKYLTEIICLDLGHMKLTRTDFLANMTKLQYLIIADTPISDITALSNLKELKFLEIFMTDVTDFSPLVECKNLVDLNICYTDPESIEPFCQMTWLEHFWFQGMWRPDWMAQLNESLPNTQIMYGGSSSTGFGWRDLPNYFAQRDILGMPYMTG